MVKLKEEEEYQRNRVLPHELDPTRPIVEAPRSSTYIRNDEAIRVLVNNFDALAPNERNDQTWITHLHAISFRLTTKGIDHWID